MTKEKFSALVVREDGEKNYICRVEERTVDDLPQGDVLINVAYSSLNYKDALSATGNKGVTRKYPHTPGIDAAGTVAHSQVEQFAVGDRVLVTGYDLGMNTAGGFGQFVRVPASWVVPIPHGLSAKESMIYGTAGFTAAMSVLFLTEGVRPEDGTVLVTGATGGVGSVSVSLLAKLGYRVTAVTGKMDEVSFLKRIGASDVLERADATETSGRPLLKSRWAGVIDTVGGEILATAIKSTHPLGIVTCCGNVASPDLPLTVFPFILRGVRLVGVDSQNCPMDIRRKVWKNLADAWRIDSLSTLCRTIPLNELSENIDRIRKGKLRGRVVVDLNG